jgi:predicted PurR-regulated permease PerM
MSKVPTFTKEELKMPDERFGEKIDQETPSVAGIVLSILIVILVLILGGLYMWGTEIQKALNTPEVLPTNSRPTPAQNNEPESTNAEAAVESLNAMSTSNEIAPMQADLESTLIDTNETDLNAIDEVVKLP